MQYHCMKITSNTINTLNPGQIPVKKENQLIFALKNELMIRFLDQSGPDKYSCLFVSLHTEQ